ncbi:myosin-7-like [Hyposmocoma kahamanoa]|uniref:myosin-7-like n=1 Tax=Hyposmocoma kahamanoa TaxID=1477025 RepID=UPI000E6D6D6B|nr:myosin-7-like [Hyposmocoma kahamanoa]
MMTRRMLSEEKSKKMEAELNELRALTDRLLEERDVYEMEMQALKTSRMTLKGKFDEIRLFCEELEKECKRKELIIESFRENQQEHEDALDRITFLERQVKESNAEVASLHEQSGSYDHLTTLSLRDELALGDRNVCNSKLCSTKSQDPRFSKLTNLIRKKSKTLKKLKSEKLNLHKDKVKMAEQVKDLELDLQSRTKDLLSTQKQLEELSAATNELLKLGTEYRELTQVLLHDELSETNGPVETNQTPSPPPTSSTQPTRLSYASVAAGKRVCSTTTVEVRHSQRSTKTIRTPTRPSRRTVVFSDKIGVGLGPPP